VYWIEYEKNETFFRFKVKDTLEWTTGTKKETLYAPLHETVSKTYNLKSVERIKETQLFHPFAWHERIVLNQGAGTCQ
jgi:hypothetical protein